MGAGNTRHASSLELSALRRVCHVCSPVLKTASCKLRLMSWLSEQWSDHAAISSTWNSAVLYYCIWRRLTAATSLRANGCRTVGPLLWRYVHYGILQRSAASSFSEVAGPVFLFHVVFRVHVGAEVDFPCAILDARVCRARLRYRRDPTM